MCVCAVASVLLDWLARTVSRLEERGGGAGGGSGGGRAGKFRAVSRQMQETYDC